MPTENLWTPTGPTVYEQIKEIENAGWSLFPDADRPLQCDLGTMEYLDYLKMCGK